MTAQHDEYVGKDTMKKMNNAATKAQTILTNILDGMGFVLIRNQIEEVLEGTNTKDIEVRIQALADRRRTVYAHVKDEGGFAEAIRLMREEGVIQGAVASGFAAAGAVESGAKACVGYLDALFAHAEGEGAFMHFIRSFYFGVRNVAKTIIEKGLEIAKVLLRGIWALIRKFIAWLMNFFKKLINKAKAHKLGDSLVGCFDDIEDDDFDDMDDLDDIDDIDAYNTGVDEVCDGFQRFSNCEVAG